MNFPRPRAALAALAAVVVAAGGLSACSSSAAGGDRPPVQVAPSSSSSGFSGDVLDQPLALTQAARRAVWRSSAGGTTSLGALQHGHLMLLYFGYTHCPDVCPTTMADLGQALRQLPPLTQAHTQVVFVTSDPVRDTPAVMRTWLSNFDGGLPLPFVGLTASTHQIDSIAKSVGVPLSPPVREKNGSIGVQHGAQTMAFAGGRAKVLWLAGTTPGGYAHDIGKLILQVQDAP